VLGAKGGLAPALLVDILKESAAASKMVDVRGPLMVSHRFDPQMKVDLFLKDFKLMLDEGRRLEVPLPLTSVTQQLATATAVAGRGEEDLAAIVTTLERLAGLKQDRSSKISLKSCTGIYRRNHMDSENFTACELSSRILFSRDYLAKISVHRSDVLGPERVCTQNPPH
jgi:hypothetical protein